MVSAAAVFFLAPSVGLSSAVRSAAETGKRSSGRESNGRVREIFLRNLRGGHCDAAKLKVTRSARCGAAVGFVQSCLVQCFLTLFVQNWSCN